MPKAKKMDKSMDMGGMFWLHALSFLLVIVGGLNWGLVGIANINLVHWIFGAWPMVEQIIYVLVGLGAVYLIFTHKNDCKSCSMMMK